MTDPLDDDLRNLIEGRARVRPEDLEPLRRSVAALPARRRVRPAALAAAAGVVVLLGLGGLLVARLPVGTSGAAPGAPDPAAFAGDPRLAVCGVTADDAIAIFELAHVRDYPRQLPAAYELVGLDEDPEAPALVVVLDGPGSLDRMGSPAPEGSHDLCLVIGGAPASWDSVRVQGVDTSGLLAFLPEPTGTPIPDDLAPWVDRCGGVDAGIVAAVRFDGGTDPANLVVDPVPAELATGMPGAVIVYDTAHPFEPLGTPPAPDATIEPREPLAEGRHDLCVLIGADPVSAERSIHEDVRVDFATPADASLSPGPSAPAEVPTPDAGSVLPAQVDPADCDRMSFAPDRCAAVVERARQGLDLEWADVAAVGVAEYVPDGVARSSYSGIASVTFVLRDGSGQEFVVACAGIGNEHDLVCTDRPEIRLSAPYGPGAGYHDVPCSGEGPTGCATPVPAIDPAAAASAVPLEIAAHDFPITKTGRLEIEVGRATLPNGVLSDARFTLADPFTRAFSAPDGVHLEVRSLEPTRPPFFNAYEHGWYPGTEEVAVVLVLDVTSVTPGAMLEVRDLVVR